MANGSGGQLAIAVVSVLTAMFDAVTEYGVVGRAHATGLWRLTRIDPRDYAANRQRNVDDRPYGGGPGMVMAAPPLAKAIGAARCALRESPDGTVGGERPRVLYLSPQGRPLEQRDVARIMAARRLVLVCGRYEGIDERLVQGC